MSSISQQDQMNSQDSAQAAMPSKNALKNARKRANKRAAKEAAASAAAAVAAVQAAAAFMPQPCYNCRRHSARRPLAWGPEAEGDCPWAGPAHDSSVPAGSSCAPVSAPSTPPPSNKIPLSVATLFSAAAAAGGVIPPPSLPLLATLSRPRFAVSGRSGECSPDCSCVSGFSCGDRTAPWEEN